MPSLVWSIASRFSPYGLCCLTVLAGCATALPLPKVAAPELVERVDVVPPVPVSTFAVLLGLNLRVLEPLLTDLLNTELPLRQADWTRVTGDGANPQVETRMQAKVDKLKLTVKGHVLQVQARFAYWGKARAQLATPFGKAWLSRGTDWGTEKHPGTVTLTLALTPSLSRAYALTTHSSLARVSFEAPPGDALCGKIVIKVCVPREQAAKEVHAALKRTIEEVSPQLLVELDRRLARETDVAAALALALGTLEHATPAPDGTWLKLTVEEIALGELTGKGARAGVPLELRMRTLFGSQEPDVVRELPERKDPQGVATDLTFDAALSFAQLSQSLSSGLSGVRDGPFRLSTLTVLGVSKSSGKLLMSLDLLRESEQLTLYAEAQPVLEGDRLVLSGVQLTEGSRRALSQLALHERVLIAALSKQASSTLTTLVTPHLEAVRAKVQTPLLLFGTLTLRFEGTPVIEGLRYAQQGLVVRVHGPARSELQ